MLDDFVSSIVEQVVSGGKSSTAGQAASGGRSTSSVLNRPNYQREKAKSRLAAYDISPKTTQSHDTKPSYQVPTPYQAPAAHKAPTSYQAPASYQAPSKPYSYDDGFSGMRRVMLDTDSVPKKAVETSCSYCAEPVKSGLSMRILQKADKRVARMLDLPFRGDGAIGVINDGRCTVSNLFAADSVLTSLPSLYGNVNWSDEPGESFCFKISGTIETVNKAAALFEKVLSEGKSAGVFKSEMPSVLLQRHLKLNSRYTVAAIEGVNTADAAAAVNSYYSENAESMAEFSLGSGYLLIQGDETELKSAITSIRNSLSKGEFR